MGRKAKAPPPEEVEDSDNEESSDNSLEADEGEPASSETGDTKSSYPATFHEGIELLKLLADYGYDVEGGLTNGTITFTFSSKSKHSKKRRENLDDLVQHNARYANCDDLSRNEYEFLANAGNKYTEPPLRDDRSVKSKKGSSKRVTLANWVKT